MTSTKFKGLQKVQSIAHNFIHKINMYEIFIRIDVLFAFNYKKCQLNEPFEILPIYFCKGFQYTLHLGS